MVRYYGPPSIFYTLTQDNIHGLLNLRMSLPLMYNWSFIATENGFAEALRQQKLEFQTISISESGLRMLLANGLMAAGDVFKTSMKALFSDLCAHHQTKARKKQYRYQTDQKAFSVRPLQHLVSRKSKRIASYAYSFLGRITSSTSASSRRNARADSTRAKCH